jgi:hypothetical protein
LDIDNSSPPLPPKKKRRFHGQKTASVPFDIFNDKRTKSLFNCKNRADFQERINRMCSALVKFAVVTVCLPKPHPTRKSEPLSEYNVLALYSKLTLLTLTYEITVEEYLVHFN